MAYGRWHDLKRFLKVNRSVRWIFGCVLVLGMTLSWGVCSKTKVRVDLNSAAQPMDDLAISRDIAYADGDRHRLDVYAPRSRSEANPVLVFFYGGGWDSGAKADFAWVGAAMARRGYVVVIPDYRIYPEVIWPKFLEDNAAAVRWTRDHVASYGGDPSTLVLMGHSAGAYNAVTLVIDRRWLAGAGMDFRYGIRAAIGLSGPYDFLPLDRRRLKIIFGPEERLPDTQPINHVDGAAAPVLLLTGDRDDVVDPPESDRLAVKIHENRGSASVVHYPLLDHSGTLDAIAGPPDPTAPVLNDISCFIAAQGIRLPKNTCKPPSDFDVHSRPAARDEGQFCRSLKTLRTIIRRSFRSLSF